jgi:hypothetical protein
MPSQPSMSMGLYVRREASITWEEIVSRMGGNP